MQIAKIEVFQVDLPYRGGVYRLSGGREFRSFDGTIVCVTTDNGLEGWGESTPFGATYIAAHGAGVRAGLSETAPAVLGLDPRHVDRVYARMDEVLVGHRHAKTPIDVACWDLFGKAVDMPVCDLLGGRIPGPIPVISSIHTADPDQMRASIAHHRAEGFKGHSLKVGAADHEGGPALDAERIKACLADRQPGEWYLVDANGGLSVEHALRMLNLLPSGLDFVLEAPCASWRETVSLKRRVSVPILWDELIQSEEDLIQIIVDDTGDGIGLKVSKQGGLTPCRRQRDIAQASGLVISVQETTGSQIALAALLHMASTVSRKLLRCALDTRSVIAATTASLDAPILNGGVEVPQLPGLGLEVDRAALGDPIAVYEGA